MVEIMRIQPTRSGKFCPKSPFEASIMESLGTLLRFWGVFQFTQVQTPPLTPQTMLDARIQNFFRVSTLYREGGGRNTWKFRKGCTVLRGNREMTEKYEYCSTDTRTFVQDCTLAVFWSEFSGQLNMCFFPFFSVLLDWMVLILLWSERPLPWPFKTDDSTSSRRDVDPRGRFPAVQGRTG